MSFQRSRFWALVLVLVPGVTQPGCAHKIARIGPGEWDRLASRTYAAPKDKTFSAAWKYLQSIGMVTRAERESGFIAARVGIRPPDVSTAFTEMATMPEYTCSVFPSGQDSSKVTLKILNSLPPRSGRTVSTVVETARLPYTATLDSIATFLVPRRAPARAPAGASTKSHGK